MKANHHSLTLSIKRKPHCYLLSFKATGQLAAEDFNMITPIVVSVLSSEVHPRLDVFIDITQLRGWTLRAAWNNFIMSIKHCSELHRVAIYGTQGWQKILSKAGDWLISGEIRFFDARASAVNWIEET